MHLYILSLKRRYDVQVPDQRTVSYLTNSTLLVVPLSYSRVLLGLWRRWWWWVFNHRHCSGSNHRYCSARFFTLIPWLSLHAPLNGESPSGFLPRGAQQRLK